MGDDFLNNNTVMGDSIKTSQEFWYSHKELDSEKEVNKCLHSLMLKLSQSPFSVTSPIAIYVKGGFSLGRSTIVHIVFVFL